MIRLFLNGLGASAGAGLTYLHNVVPHLSSLPDTFTTLAVQTALRAEFAQFPSVEVDDIPVPSSVAARFWFEQRHLHERVRKSGADVLISAGNFALRNSPVPQILLSGNSLYTSPDFARDLRSRREYEMLLDTRVKGIFARKSISWADCTVAPTRAYAEELQRWSGKSAVAIHHGFDHVAFFRDQSPLSSGVQQKLDSAKDCLKLLFVSHYNYYRNFETLLRAIPLLRVMLPERNIRLFLTCELREGESSSPGTYCSKTAAALINKLEIRQEVVELGAIPYHLLHKVYRACDIYVTPAYTETFAHPLVEAMASGLPVVASDLAVHREVCGSSALYFERFSPDMLAERISEIARLPETATHLSTCGSARAREFSWSKHVSQLLDVARRLRPFRAAA